MAGPGPHGASAGPTPAQGPGASPQNPYGANPAAYAPPGAAHREPMRPQNLPPPGRPGGVTPRLDVPHDLDEDPIDEPRKPRWTWLIVFLVIVLSIGAGALYGLVKTGRLKLSALPTVSSPTGASPVAAPKLSKLNFAESALKGYAPAPAEVDAAFQKSGLWQLIKRDFPAWYQEAVAETAKLKADGTDDRTISVGLMRKLVELRRKNAGDALAAKPAHLQAMAQTFVDNLGSLSRVSVEACYRFISGGETDPMMIEMMRSPDHTAPMQAQLAAIFEAIADGKVTKSKIAPAERKDYDMLAAQLSLRGWSPADLALFDDARALSRATPQKVCQMVQDWFSAQLSVKDVAVQTRLFGATLKPLIGE